VSVGGRLAVWGDRGTTRHRRAKARPSPFRPR
jgi:hypothetical protein